MMASRKVSLGQGTAGEVRNMAARGKASERGGLEKESIGWEEGMRGCRVMGRL